MPGLLIEALRSAGHDVLSIGERYPGWVDRRVLALAVAEDRTLLTFDKDFGELVHRLLRPMEPGVILIRFRDSPKATAERLTTLLADGDRWRGAISVVHEEAVRVRLLR